MLLGACRPVPTAGPSENGSVSPESELPDHVIEAMLQRELLLTNAKLHGLANDHTSNERKLRSLRTQLRQASHPLPRWHDVTRVESDCTGWCRPA